MIGFDIYDLVNDVSEHLILYFNEVLQKDENARPANIVIVSDSGVEDSSTYLQPTETHLGEGKSNALDLSSTPEAQGTWKDFMETLKFIRQQNLHLDV